jgi:hypothetical protein
MFGPRKIWQPCCETDFQSTFFWGMLNECCHLVIFSTIVSLKYSDVNVLLLLPTWGAFQAESGAIKQGCQIFLDTIYHNEGKYTKLPQLYEMAIKYIK